MRYCSTSALVLMTVGLAACGGGGSAGGGSSGSGSQSGNDQPSLFDRTPVNVSFTQTATTASFETAEYFRSGALGQVNASSIYSVGGTGAGQLIAIVDTGIDTDHPQFAARIDPNSTYIVSGNPADVEDASYHGTIVAGIAAAPRDGSGLHGLAFDADILAIRADSPGSCASSCSFSQANLASATDYAVAQNADVVNFSLGGATALASSYRAALDRAVDAGLVLVFAAGNDGDSDPTYPGRYAAEASSNGQAIVVGAVNSGNTIASFSNRAGSAADSYLVAPGVNIESTFPGGGNAVASGTSMASPVVAGAAAALMDAAPSLTADQVVTLLLTTATDLGEPGVDEIYGWGLLNLAEAIQPQGTLTIPASSHVDDAGPAAAASALSLSGPLAGASLPASAVMMLDAFGRPYYTPLGEFGEWQADPVDIERFLERRDEKSAKAQFLDGRLSLSAFDADGEDRQLLIEHDLGSGLRFAAFADERGRLGQISDPLSFDLLQDEAAGYAFSGLVAGGGLSISQDMPNGLGLSLTAAGGGEESQAAASRLLAAGLTMPLGDSTDFGFRAGQLDQQDAVLGTAGFGAFAQSGWQSTHFAEFSMETGLVEGQTLFWRAALGRSHGRDATASQPLALEDFWSTSWALGWQGTRILDKSDRLTISLSQPLRAENAGVSTNLPVERTLDGGIVRERNHERLDGQGREIDLELAYRRAVGEDSDLGLNLLLRHEPGHNAKADDELVGVATYRLRF